MTPLLLPFASLTSQQSFLSNLFFHQNLLKLSLIIQTKTLRTDLFLHSFQIKKMGKSFVDMSVRCK